MRHKFKIIFITFSSLFVVLLYFIIFNLNTKNINNKTIVKLPIILLTDIKNNLFSNNDIDQKKSRLIINHFNPNCEHCQYMACEFLKDSQKIKNVQILMITSADSASVAKFNSDYKLSLLPNIFISSSFGKKAESKIKEKMHLGHSLHHKLSGRSFIILKFRLQLENRLK